MSTPCLSIILFFNFGNQHDIDITITVNDGVEIKYVKRERPSLRKDAIPAILPGCPSYYTKKPVWATRLSLEEKDEELFYIARNLSLEILGTEGIKYKVNYFSDIKDRLDSSYPNPWLVWFSLDNMQNFIYPLKCDEGIEIAATLVIDSTMIVSCFLHSKEICLMIHSINNTRQIEPLLKKLANRVTSHSKRPMDMITEANLLLHNAIHTIEALPESDDKESNNTLLPYLQFTVCQLSNLCVSKYKRRYNTLTQIVALKAHLISPTCYSFLQSLECIALPHITTIQRLYSSFGLDCDYATFLQ